MEKLIIPLELMSVNELRNKIQNKENEICRFPGVYKFWADETYFKKILNGYKSTNKKFEIESFDEIKDNLEKASINGKEVYCFYVGKADKRAVSERIKGHINKNGGSSLYNKITKFNNENYEEFMNDLYFSCELYNVSLKSYSAALITSQQELFHINSYLRILNDDDNFLLKGKIN